MVQVYVHDGHSKIDRPAHELKAFERVELKPGETKTVEFSLESRSVLLLEPERGRTGSWSRERSRSR